MQSLKNLVKNNFPKSLFSLVKPFVLSLLKHDRLEEVFPPILRQGSPEFTEGLRANGKISSAQYREIIADHILS